MKQVVDDAAQFPSWEMDKKSHFDTWHGERMRARARLA